MAKGFKHVAEGYKKITDEELAEAVKKAKEEGHNKTWLKYDLEGQDKGVHDKRLKEAWNACTTS